VRRFDGYAAAAAVLGLAGLGWRVWLTAAATPPTNSDEAIMGLAASHIAQGRELPVFFYGQHYMGTIEAYLSAPFVALTGPTVLAMRIPTLACYATFLVLMFVLVRRLYSAGLAVLTVGLLALGSDRSVKNQLLAGGGYPESLPMVAGLVLLTYALLTGPRRWYAHAGWGLLAGLLAWNHWLAAPYVLGALVALVAGRAFGRRTALTAGGGFVLGALPLIVDNVRSWPVHSLAVFVGLNGAGATPLVDRVVGGAWLGVPLGTGFCAPGRCAWWSLWWGPVLLVLLAVAAWRAVRALRRREDTSRQAVRLVLAAAGLASVVSYVRSPAAGLTPVETARYLGLLLVSLPAALWPLWRLVRRDDTRRPAPLAATGVLAAIVATAAAATVALVPQIALYRQYRADQDAVLAALRPYRYVQGEYWTCNWISWLSDERTVCGVLDDDMSQGHNRLPYWQEGRVPQAVIAPVGHPLDRTLAGRFTTTPRRVGGHHIYLPV
jgi:hypothetical protein